MVDLVLAVSDSKSWHEENIARNPHHYSWLARQCGPGAVARAQDTFGAGLWYNTLVSEAAYVRSAVILRRSSQVPIPAEVPGVRAGQQMKYGVIELERLIRDLREWDTLYVAGRMHKPVRIFHDVTQGAVSAAQEANLEACVRTALLLLPQRFRWQDALMAIAGLSYAGDFRMVFGENPLKVQNIVHGQFQDLTRMYWDRVLAIGSAGPLRDVSLASVTPGTMIEQDMALEVREVLFHGLPPALQARILRKAALGLEAPDIRTTSPTLPRAAANAARFMVKRLQRSQSPSPWWAPVRPSSKGVTRSRAAIGVAAMAVRTATKSALSRLRPSPTVRSVLAPELIPRLIRPCLAQVVGTHAATQSFKGLVTTSPAKSFEYAAAKLSKAVKLPSKSVLLATGVAVASLTAIVGVTMVSK
jgi:hypothetical protein